MPSELDYDEYNNFIAGHFRLKEELLRSNFEVIIQMKEYD